MVVMQVLVKSHKIKACKEGVADLSRGGLSGPMHERPNTRKKGDADLSTVLIGLSNLHMFVSIVVQCLVLRFTACYRWS